MTARKVIATPSSPHADVAAYLATLPEDVRLRVVRIRAEILKAVPDASEGFSYRMPAYKLAGRPLLYVAAFKEHIGVYPMTGNIKEAFAAQLAPYAQSKGTVRFRHDAPIPYALIGKLAKYRAREINEAAALKASPARNVPKAAARRRRTGSTAR